MALAMQDVKALIDKLDKENALSLDEWEELIPRTMAIKWQNMQRKLPVRGPKRSLATGSIRED